MKKLWTNEDKKFVKKLFAKGKTYAEIANVMGRTQMSVKQFVQRNREEFGASSVKSEKKELEAHARIKEMWNNGEPITYISLALNLDFSVLKNYINRRREDFPRREVLSIRRESIAKPKPTPENTEIQYEYKEIPTPEEALHKPFFCVEVGECSWILETFWQEPKFDSPCCAAPVVDLRGKGLKRSYCQYHLDASLEKK